MPNVNTNMVSLRLPLADREFWANYGKAQTPRLSMRDAIKKVLSDKKAEIEGKIAK